jgi:hypothetical protein
VSYVGLGSRVVTATADTTGLNAGNYTCSFTPAVINVNVPYAEIYHMVVTGAIATPQATIYLNNKFYGFCYPNVGSEWNPAQPILLNPSDELDFCWNQVAGTANPPVVTVYLRYDPELNGGMV